MTSIANQAELDAALAQLDKKSVSIPHNEPRRQATRYPVQCIDLNTRGNGKSSQLGCSNAVGKTEQIDCIHNHDYEKSPKISRRCCVSDNARSSDDSFGFSNNADPDHLRFSTPKTLEIPIHLKMNLTIREAAAYSNIGINKLESMLKDPHCTFVLFVGTKKLVKRKLFEDYISKQLVI